MGGLQKLINELSERLNQKEDELDQYANIREDYEIVVRRNEQLASELANARQATSIGPDSRNMHYLEDELEKFKKLLQKKEEEILNQSRTLMIKDRSLRKLDKELLTARADLEK